MSRSRDNADAVTTVPSGVGRNMIINGAMNVAQRSASVTGIGATGGYFTCDRWYIHMGVTSAGRLTMTQTADGPNGISANCIKLDCTTVDTSIAAGERFNLWQQIEGQNLQRIGKGVAGAKEITVSFYVKANAAFTFGCELFDLDNSRQITKLFDTTTGWVRHELTFPADVDDGSSPLDDDNASSMILEFWLHGGSTYTSGTLNTTAFADQTAANRAAGIDSFFSSTDNNFFITGVQMEVGPVATEFEQEDISTTLAKCQRYYYKTAGTSSSFFGQGMCVNTTEVRGSVPFPVEMRSAPTALEQNGTAAHYRVNGTADTVCSAVPAFLVASTASAGVTFTVGSGLTAGQGTTIQSKAAGAYLAWSSEL